MGTLQFFDLNKYKDFGVFIETGTGKGESLKHARNFKFKSIFSIECVDVLFFEARAQLRNTNAVLLFGVSWKILRKLLPVLKYDKCVFWLDAHLPGVDYGLAEYFDEKDPDIRMPLIKELETIKELRPEGKDVILIDDISFYNKDKFESGCLPDHLINEGYDHIISLFENTHSIVKHLDDEGYLEMVPK